MQYLAFLSSFSFSCLLVVLFMAFFMIFHKECQCTCWLVPGPSRPTLDHWYIAKSKTPSSVSESVYRTRWQVQLLLEDFAKIRTDQGHSRYVLWRNNRGEWLLTKYCKFKMRQATCEASMVRDSRISNCLPPKLICWFLFCISNLVRFDPMISLAVKIGCPGLK